MSHGKLFPQVTSLSTCSNPVRQVQYCPRFADEKTVSETNVARVTLRCVHKAPCCPSPLGALLHV